MQHVHRQWQGSLDDLLPPFVPVSICLNAYASSNKFNHDTQHDAAALATKVQAAYYEGVAACRACRPAIS